MAKIYAVCSGCGGVGKTMIALSLAVSAAKRRKRTILLDASGVSPASDMPTPMPPCTMGTAAVRSPIFNGFIFCSDYVLRLMSEQRYVNILNGK